MRGAPTIGTTRPDSLSAAGPPSRAVTAGALLLATALAALQFVPTAPALAALAYFAVAVPSVVAVAVAAARSGGPTRRALALLAAGTGLWLAGDAAARAFSLAGAQPSFPSLVDAAYLAAYVPLLGAFATLFGRRRAPVLLDAAIVAAGVQILAWPLLYPGLASALEALASTAYPTLDLVVLFTLGGLLPARRPAASFPALALLAGAAALVVADQLYLLGGPGHEAGWMLTYAFWAAAASRLPRRPAPPAEGGAERLAWPRLAALAAVCPAAVAVLVVDAGGGNLGVAAGWGAVLALLVLARMGLLLRDRDRAERASARLAREYELLLASVGDGVLAVDLGGRITHANTAAERMLGYGGGELVGLAMDASLGHALGPGAEPSPVGDVGKVPGTLRRRDGSALPVEYSASPVVEDGRLRGVVGVFRDVSVRVAADEALRASEARYRELFENAYDLRAIVRLDRTVVAVNAAFEDVLGYSREELVGRKADPLMADVPAAQERMDATLAAAGRTLPFEVRAVAKDGRAVPLEVTLQAVLEDGVPVAVQMVARDVSERNRLEEQLRQAQKLEAVGRLAGGIAHEFNNLLAAITGYAYLASTRIGDGDPELREDVEEIATAAARAAALTRELVAFSRREDAVPEALCLNRVVAGAETLLRRMLGDGVELVQSLDPALGTTLADRGQLEQILRNLAANAREAMPDGGTLTIETANLDPAAGRPPEPCVSLIVRDSGRGTDEATRQRAFEPFFTTKPPGAGAGLGLAVVHGIVTQAGGSVTLESEPGAGTAVRILLPRLDAPVRATEPAGAEPLPSGHETILLVEDEEPQRELVSRVLRTHGYRVLVAASAGEALALARAHEGPLDLLLTDVVMPDMSGRELAVELVLERPLPVLYTSGYCSAEIAAGGRLGPELTFLEKPYGADALVHRVRDLLDAASADGPTVPRRAA